ncbi:RNA methyltransferase [candidate division KSB1 bacterium]|nr:RNA methyltransferase [candidate division KSB1 bacterium]TDI93059.1 MAG: RNA methyltransferase [Caldithrix sp.]TDI94171.1 MAG: RNA methyltransferase [Caldithrix sp.]
MHLNTLPLISKTQLKYYISLKKKQVRELEQKFIVEGLRLCEEIFDSEYEFDELLYCPAKISTKRATHFVEKCISAGVPTKELNIKSLKHISDTMHSQGIVGIIKMQRLSIEQLMANSPQGLVALDNINDPGNLGTIIRSASWFGANGVLLSQNSVELTNPKVVRASMGSLFHLPILQHLNLYKELDKLNELGYALFVADASGDIEYATADFSKKWVLIFGNEITGVSEEIKGIASGVLNIPRKGKGESLNVAVSAGIILAETLRQYKN